MKKEEERRKKKQEPEMENISGSRKRGSGGNTEVKSGKKDNHRKRTKEKMGNYGNMKRKREETVKAEECEGDKDKSDDKRRRKRPKLERSRG